MLKHVTFVIRGLNIDRLPVLVLALVNFFWWTKPQKVGLETFPTYSSKINTRLYKNDLSQRLKSLKCILLIVFICFHVVTDKNLIYICHLQMNVTLPSLNWHVVTSLFYTHSHTHTFTHAHLHTQTHTCKYECRVFQGFRLNLGKSSKMSNLMPLLTTYIMSNSFKSILFITRNWLKPKTKPP